MFIICCTDAVIEKSRYLSNLLFNSFTLEKDSLTEVMIVELAKV